MSGPTSGRSTRRRSRAKNGRCPPIMVGSGPRQVGSIRTSRAGARERMIDMSGMLEGVGRRVPRGNDDVGTRRSPMPKQKTGRRSRPPASNRDAGASDRQIRASRRRASYTRSPNAPAAAASHAASRSNSAPAALSAFGPAPAAVVPRRMTSPRQFHSNVPVSMAFAAREWVG